MGEETVIEKEDMLKIGDGIRFYLASGDLSTVFRIKRIMPNRVHIYTDTATVTINKDQIVELNGERIYSGDLNINNYPE